MSKGKITERQLHESVLKLIEDNSVRLVHKKSSTTITTVAEKIAINIPEYDKNTDILMVYENSTYIEEGDDYTISEDGMYILSTNGNWNTFEEKTTFNFVTIKSIPKIQSGDVITCVITVQSTDWEYSEEECLYYKDVVHNLGTDHLFVSGKDPDTKDSIEVMVRYTDENNIRIYNEAETNIMVNLVSAKTENNLIINKIDDMHVKEDATWSSNKIKNQITAVNTRITENMNEVNQQFITIDNKLDEIMENAGVSEADMIDYMGRQHITLKATNDSNIEYMLRKVNTQKYEGSTITATNTYAKQVNDMVLKGNTKYKDLITGEFIDSYEEDRNLKLVGGKCSKIIISNENLFNPNDINISSSLNYVEPPAPNRPDAVSTDIIKNDIFKPGQTYYFHTVACPGVSDLSFYRLTLMDSNKNVIEYKSIETGRNATFTPNKEFAYYRIGFRSASLWTKGISLINDHGFTLSDVTISTSKLMKHVPYVSQTVNLSHKELHSKGDVCDELQIGENKLIQRFNSVILDGGDNIEIVKDVTKDNTARFLIKVPNLKKCTNYGDHIMSSTYRVYKAKQGQDEHEEGMTVNGWTNSIGFHINIDKIGENTVTAFKKWLNVNKIDVTYELEEPCEIKIDLQGQKIYSYDGTTSYTSQSELGYPSPILSLEVPTDLASLVSSQQLELNILTRENKELKEVNEEQDKLIDSSLLATDEMYQMIESLLVNTISNDSNNTYMVNMYINMVKRKLKEIDEVPVRFREQVREILEGTQE